MSFMEIKRFVNSGNTPLNTLIGTEIKNKINGDGDKALDVLIKELLNSGDNGLAVLKELLTGTSDGVTGIDSTTSEILSGLNNSTYGLEAIKNALGSGGGGIKSVQRGIVVQGATSSGYTTNKIVTGYGGTTWYEWYVDIPISSVDINKSFTIVNLFHRGSGYGGIPANPIGSLLNSNIFRVWHYYSDTSESISSQATFSWQVIEFN